MKIELEQAEVEQLVKEHLNKVMNLAPNQKIASVVLGGSYNNTRVEIVTLVEQAESNSENELDKLYQNAARIPMPVDPEVNKIVANLAHSEPL